MIEQPIDLLITGGTVLTMDPGDMRIPDGAVAVAGGKIVSLEAAGDKTPRQGVQCIDARGCIVMPGLVNTHTHLPMAMFRGLADDLPLDIWLNEHMFPAEASHVRPDTVGPASRLACAEMLLSGTTTCCDGYFHEDEVANAVLDAGLRAVLAQGVIDFPAPGVPDPRGNVKQATAFVETWVNKSPRISPSVFCHSPYTCSPETLQKAKAASDSRGCLFQIHVAETQQEYDQCMAAHGMTPIQYLDHLGLLDDRSLLIHVIWVNERDMEIISKRGSSVSVTTESEMKLASGIAPVPGFLEAGIPLGLGTDGCASNNDLDLFQEMDITAKLHKVDQGNPSAMDAKTVLSLATLGGARALGLETQIGSLAVGKQADIIIIDMMKPHLVPLYDEVSHIVYAVAGSDVRDAMVAGKLLVRNRNLLTMDLQAIIADVARIGAGIRPYSPSNTIKA